MKILFILMLSLSSFANDIVVTCQQNCESLLVETQEFSGLLSINIETFNLILTSPNNVRRVTRKLAPEIVSTGVFLRGIEYIPAYLWDAFQSKSNMESVAQCLDVISENKTVVCNLNWAQNIIVNRVVRNLTCD